MIWANVLISGCFILKDFQPVLCCSWWCIQQSGATFSGTSSPCAPRLFMCAAWAL